MTGKKGLLALLVVVMLALGMLIGCGGTEEAAAPGDQVEKSTPAASDENDLAKLFAKAEKVPGLYYELVMNSPEMDAQMTGKFWIKGEKIRTEFESPDGAGTMVNIMNNKEAFMVMESQGIATRMDLSQFNEADNTPKDAMKDLAEEDAKLIGKETIDGKKCLIYESKAAEENYKAWIWEEYGVPVKVETTTEEGTAVIEFKNIAIKDIPDNMFELPAGVEVMDMPQIPQIPQMP